MGLLGGGVSSRRAEARRSGKAGEEKKKKAPPFRTILRDAVDLVAARRGRLALGLGILFINRLAGFVIPFMAVYAPALMLQPGGPIAQSFGYPAAVAYIVLKACLAIALWGAAAAGYLKGPLGAGAGDHRRLRPRGGAAGQRRGRISTGRPLSGAALLARPAG